MAVIAHDGSKRRQARETPKAAKASDSRNSPTPDPVVFLVDEDPAFRDWLSSLLLTLGLEVSTHQTAQSFLQVYDASRPSCVVLDPRMPRVGGRALLEKLARQRFSPPVIVVMGSADVETAVELMKLGAFDFMTKPVREQRLIDAVSRALDVDAAARPDFREMQRYLARDERLTVRERQVMGLLADAEPNARIAARLGIAQRTVELHRAHINSKMGVRSLAELLVLVVRFRELQRER